jgi:Flp pilus assembly protein TadD
MRPRNPTRIACALLVLAALTGCASYRGARLYVSGTEALDRGDPAQAVADLERAAELVPQASEVQNHLGLAYAAAGRDGEALAAFHRAVDLDCENAAAAQNLAAAERRAAAAQPASAPAAGAAP